MIPFKIAGGAFAAGLALAAIPLMIERGEHRDTRRELTAVRALYDAERDARQGAADKIIAAQAREAELSAERDAALREAAEARARTVTRTVEVIREIDPEWSAAPVPDPVRAERLRGWCDRRPERADHPLCGDPAEDDSRSGG